MIRLCRRIDATTGTDSTSLPVGEVQQMQTIQHHLPSPPLTKKATSSNTLLFEREESQQLIVIDVTSISDGIESMQCRDSKSASFRAATMNRDDSIQYSPTSVKDFSNMHQDEYQPQWDASYRDVYESYNATWRQPEEEKERRTYRWIKMIEEADWTLLYKSLMRCKRQRSVVSEDMIIYSECNTTVLHLAAQKAPAELILLILDVVTTCCQAHSTSNAAIGGTPEINSKNYCLCGDNDGNTPLHISCANLERTVIRDSGQVTIDFSVVKNLLVLGPEALVMQNNNGDTPLHLLLASKALEQPDDSKTTKNAVSSAVEAVAAILGMVKDMALTQNVNGLTPLHVAIANHCPKSILLQLLLMAPKAAAIADNDGMNSMHYVASFGVQSWSFVQQLIAAFPEIIYQRTIHGDTPLHLLVANTSLAYFPGMTQALSKVLTYNNSRHTMKLLTILSKEQGENQPISVQNAHGDTPLHFCAKMNAPTLLTQSLMASHHASVASTLTAEIDMTPLRIAMSTLYRLGDSHDAVGLRNAMCNVVALAIPEACEFVDSHGLTPLMHAVQSKKWSSWLVKIILQADPQCAKQTTPDGLLALHYACQNKKLKPATLRDLIYAYPSCAKALTKDRNTPLHYAAIQGNESVMQLLIKKYPKAVQQRNADGEWPIDLAIKYGVDPNVLEVFELSTSVPKKKKR